MLEARARTRETVCIFGRAIVALVSSSVIIGISILVQLTVSWFKFAISTLLTTRERRTEFVGARRTATLHMDR